MSAKRTIKAKEIVADLRSGMSNDQIMAKYSISSNALQIIFRKLLHANAVAEADLAGRLPGPETKVDFTKRRSVQRNYVFVRLPIYDMDNLINEGLVVDITETGLQISGMPSEKGETKGLLIQADYFADVYPFSFEAECQWVSEDEDGHVAAGFKITSISDGGLEELRKLIRMLALSD